MNSLQARRITKRRDGVTSLDLSLLPLDELQPVGKPAALPLHHGSTAFFLSSPSATKDPHKAHHRPSSGCLEKHDLQRS